MFYDKFIALCRDYGVKPTPLITSLGLSSSNAAQWRKGSTPRPQVLQKIADYFGVSVSYFYEDEKKDNSELNALLETMARREDLRMLFALAKDASPAEVRQAAKIIKALRTADDE